MKKSAAGLVDEIAEDMEKGNQTDALVMDFSKAFDKVCHSLLRYCGPGEQLDQQLPDGIVSRKLL